MKFLSRKEQILKLLATLEKGNDVSKKDMLSALTQAEYGEYLKSWSLEKQSRTSPKPSEIKIYQSLLTCACVAYAKMDVYSRKSRHDIAVLKRLVQKVDVTFAAALEYLQGAIYANGDICLWLDRDPFDDSYFSPSPSSIPRVIGSKSPECLDKRKVPYPTYSKRQIKENALLMALESLETSSKELFETYLTFPKKRKSYPELSGLLV